MQPLRRLLPFGLAGLALPVLLAVLPARGGAATALSHLASDRNINALRFEQLDIFGNTTVGRIHTIIQDAKGFIWVGTRQGAFRYDGYRIRPFLYDKLDPASIADDGIWSFHVDAQDRLWIGTQRGLSRYLPETETFRNYLAAADWPDPAVSNQVNAILHTPDGEVLAAVEAGYVYRFDEHADRMLPINEAPFGMIKSMTLDASGCLWIGVDNGVVAFNRRTGEIRRFEQDLDSVDGVSKNYVSDICYFSESEIWAGTTNNGVIVLDAVTGQTVPKPFVRRREEYVNQLSVDPLGRVWSATNAGITIFDRETGGIVRHYNQPEILNSLPVSGINALWTDTQGNLWTGSNYDGLGISSNAKRFETEPLHLRNPNLQPYSPISAFLEDHQGNLWVGDSKSGLACYPADGGPAILFEHDPEDPNSISIQPVLTLFEDSRNDLWVGAYRGGLHRYRPATQDFQRYTHNPLDPRSIAGHDIRGIAEDLHGHLWIITHGSGISHLDTHTGRFTNYRSRPENEAPDDSALYIINDWVNAIEIDREGFVWIGTPIGISVISPDHQSVRHYVANPAQPGSLSNSLVNDILEDAQGRLWIATNDGLNRYQPETDTFVAYGENDGFPHRNVSSIIDDDQGYLWAGTYDGLARFDTATGVATSYSKRDGLVSNDFFEGSVARSSKGYLYFGQNRGLTRFIPSEIRDNRTIPRVFITDVKIYDESLPIDPDADPDRLGRLQRSILETERVELDHQQNALSFSFIALNYINPQDNRYSFKLDGFDDDWSSPSARREASYTNLPPGEYVFRVRGSNNDGYWNEQGDALAVVIHPPVWGTLWFRALAVFAIVALPSLLVFWRIRSIEAKRRQLARAVDARTAELTKAHRDLEAAYARIVAQGENLERTVQQRTKELEVAKSRAERSDKLKSAFLANMSHEIRTPMNAIIGFLHILNDPNTTEKDREQFSHIINQSSRSLLSLIDDILDLSTIEAGEAEIQAQPCNLRELCQELNSMFSDALAKEGKDVALVVASHLPESLESQGPLFIQIDPLRLKQILWNLISNAIKFTDHGEIRLEYRVLEPGPERESAQIAFTVQDTGIGIPEEDLPHIFNRFHKLDRHGRKLYRGTGLGLTITRTLTELMGGSVEVQSEVDVGTTFTVRLPFHPVRAEPSDHPKSLATAALAAPDLSQRRILVVEDETPNYEYIQRVLDPTHATVDWAATGTEALQRFQPGKHHLVLLDLKLPELDGYQVAREIRRLDPDVPIIAQSAYAMRGDHEKSLAAGANEHLPKPYSPEQLLALLARYLPPDQA